MATPKFLDRLVSLFIERPPQTQLALPPVEAVVVSGPSPAFGALPALGQVPKLPELVASDYERKREMYPVIPFTGWSRELILDMLEAWDVGNFLMGELFYWALKKEGLIAAALNMRKECAQELDFVLQCPKEAPELFHVFSEQLARDWQSVMSDAVRGEISERCNLHGLAICRIQWELRGGQNVPRLIPFSLSYAMWRQDLSAYQILTEDGLEIIENDGREWAIFTLGGPRPWLKGLIRPLAFIYLGIITGDDDWATLNDKFAMPLRIQYTPMLRREGAEVHRLYTKLGEMRGGNDVLAPRDEEHSGYDTRYEQLDASAYKTIADNLARYDERAAILILGHNLLQSVTGGSLAAMKAALSLLRIKTVADCKIIMSGFECIAKVWARANFDKDDFPELEGQTVESMTWSLVYNLIDPEAQKEAAERAGQYANALAALAKAMPERLAEAPIDWVEALERCGLPMTSGEDSYSQDDDDDAELADGEYLDPPGHVKNAARRSLAWVQKLGRGGTEVGRSMARRIVRGRLTHADVVKIASYFPHHEHDKRSPNWDNLLSPSAARIAWGLWGDDGTGRGWKWAKSQMPAAKKAVGNLVSLPAPAGTPAPRSAFGPVGRSKRVKDLTGIASVACFDAVGRLLMGKRSDSGRWTMAGGHMEPGEAPAAAAARELAEEAGICGVPLLYIGTGQTENGYMVHCFRVDGVTAEPTSAGDPDGEVEQWEWVELPPQGLWSESSLPEHVRGNLHAQRNILLALLGLGSAEGLVLVRPSARAA